jgi:hypothetical protein
VVPTKTWLAIPVLAIACAGLALAANQPIEVALAVAALGAALAAAVRAFAGPSIAVAVASTAASLVGVLSLLELGVPELARASIACAAGLFAIGELVRPLPPGASPWPALGAALLAGILDPSFTPLLPIAGVRLITGPWSLPRWTHAIPVLGVLVLALAVLTVLFRDRALAELWMLWAARDVTGAEPLAIFTSTGDLLGPVTAVVAAAGLVVCALRGVVAATAVGGVLIAALGVDLVAGSTGSATVVCAALGAGSGIARFAALIRWPVGQTFVGAAVGAMLVVAPVWTLAVR